MLSEPVNVVNTVFLCSLILLSEGDMIVNPIESVGYAQTLLLIKHISFRYKAEPAPYRNTLREPMLVSEFWFFQSEKEGCPGRVNICRGDETGKTGGPHPECFPL